MPVTKTKNGLPDLFPYQKKFVEDKSQLKIWHAARQVGKSHAISLEVVLDSISGKGDDWWLVSTGERGSRELMEKVNRWNRVIAGSMGITIPHTLESCKYPNGRRITSMPSSPRSLRGFTGNIVLDEFAFHEDDDAVWEAVFPIISNEMTGNKRCIITSTGNGIHNKFYDIMVNDPSFSKHRTDIYEAMKQGAISEAKVQMIKDSMSKDQFDQEYMLAFIDSSANMYVISSEAIADCQKEHTQHIPGKVTCFMDFAAGGDENVMALVYGNKVLPLVCFTDRDTEKAASKFVTQLNQWKNTYGLTPERTWCDGSSAGGIMMANKIKALGWNINEDQMGGRQSRKSRFNSVPARQWFSAKEIIEERKVLLPDDAKLFYQLSSRKQEHDDSGKIKLESKKKIKGSPDRADAVVGALHHHGQVEKQVKDSIWDLFDQAVMQEALQVPRGMSGMHAGIY